MRHGCIRPRMMSSKRSKRGPDDRSRGGTSLPKPSALNRKHVARNPDSEQSVNARGSAVGVVPRSPAKMLAWVTVIIAASGIWRWSIVADGAPITSQGFESALRLMCGSFAFWLIGRAVIRLVLLWCRNADAHTVMHGLPVQLCAVAVGQLFAVCWLVLRSGVHEVCERWTSIGIPVTGVEVLVLLLAAASSLALELVSLARYSQSSSGSGWRSRLPAISGLVILIVLVCLAVGFREMPRVSTLSSDPDNHAHWTRMVIRLGVIPWDQGMLGIGSFGYPGGYAALNASWCALSGISVLDAVTIQPVLQFLFGCLVVAALAPMCVSRVRAVASSASTQVLTVALLLLLLYWLGLPYGMQRERYFGEGTPRLSATMFTAMVLMTWLAPIGMTLSSRERSTRIAVMAASLGVITLLNPITAVIPGLLALTAGLDECRRRFARLRSSSTASASAIALVVILGGFAMTLMSDPYFGERLFPARHPTQVLPTTPGTSAPAGGSEILSAVSAPESPLLALLSLTRLATLMHGGVPAPSPTLFTWSALLVVCAAFWAMMSPARAIRWAVLIPLLVVVHAAALCVKPVAGGPIPIYLIQPYLIDSVNQFGAVLAFCGLGVGASALTQIDRPWHKSALVLAAISLSWLPQSRASASGPEFVMRPRVARLDGNMGVPTASDLEAARFWASYSKQRVDANPPQSYVAAPKILIIGRPSDRGIEQWVFPTGGGRVLPLESALPTAFFYGHGGRDWSYSNYLAHVCENFDLPWLVDRNVRYLFLPSDRRGCLGISVDALRQRGKVLFESGDSLILELPDVP
jgi:hypothetical protein